MAGVRDDGPTMDEAAAMIHSDALVRGAADLMRTRKIRHLPVVDRAGRLIGIVTDRDLRQAIFDPSIARSASAPASTPCATSRCARS